MKNNMKALFAGIVLLSVIALGGYFEYEDSKNLEREGRKGWGVLVKIIETKRNAIGEVEFNANGLRFVERNNLPDYYNQSFEIGDTVEIIYYKGDPTNFEIISPR